MWLQEIYFSSYFLEFIVRWWRWWRTRTGTTSSPPWRSPRAPRWGNWRMTTAALGRQWCPPRRQRSRVTLQGTLSLFEKGDTYTEIGKKSWLFAKLQPGRARKRINATWEAPFSRALYRYKSSHSNWNFSADTSLVAPENLVVVPGSSKVVACIDLYPQSQAPRRAMVSIRLEIKVLSTTAKKIFRLIWSHMVNFFKIFKYFIFARSGHEKLKMSFSLWSIYWWYLHSLSAKWAFRNSIILKIHVSCGTGAFINFFGPLEWP